jgi:hypothetical protein
VRATNESLPCGTPRFEKKQKQKQKKNVSILTQEQAGIH